MKNPIIRLNTSAEQIQLYRLLYAMGYKYDDKPTVEKCLEDNELTDKMVGEWPYITANISRKDISGFKGEQSGYTSFESIGNFIKYIIDNQCPPPIVVKLNTGYKAVVSSENVTVGCQTFSFDSIKELYGAVVKMTKDSKWKIFWKKAWREGREPVECGLSK